MVFYEIPARKFQKHPKALRFTKAFEMNIISSNIPCQQKNHNFLNKSGVFGNVYHKDVNDYLNVLNIKVNIDPFNACNIRFKAPEIFPEIEIFINNLFKNDKFFPAVSMIIGGILHIIEAELKVIDGKVWKKISDKILKKVCLDLYDLKTYTRVRKFLKKTGMCEIKHFSERRKKTDFEGKTSTQRDTTCWYNITMLRTLLNQYGVTKQMLWDYAWVKSSKVREAYKRAGILAKSENTLRRKKLFTLLKIAQKKNVVSSNIKNKVYYNNNEKIENFEIKKEIFSIKSVYSPYHRLRDFTQERLDRENNVKKPKPTPINWVKLQNGVKNNYIKQIAQKLSCRYDKEHGKFEKRIIDDNLDAALDRMLQSIKVVKKKY